MPGHERQERKRKRELEQLSGKCKSIESCFVAKPNEKSGQATCTSETTTTSEPEYVQSTSPPSSISSIIPETVTAMQSVVDTSIANKVSKHVVGARAVLSLNFDWVVLEDELVEEKMTPVAFCKLCRKHNVSASGGGQTWVKQGFRTLRKDRVKDHENSIQHRKAQHLEAQLELNISQENQASSEETSLAEKLTEVIAYISDNNRPLNQFSSLIDLCIRTGSEELMAVRKAGNATYPSPETVHSLLQCLSETVDDYVLPQIRKSLTYALMLDEVCDVAVVKNLGVVVKYINVSGKAVMKFLHVSEMVRSTGADINDATLQILTDKSMKPEKCTNLTSDGASSFSGKHKGAAVLLNKEGMPMATVMHCHDHRLALACRDAFAAVGCLDVVSEGLEALYKFYSYSSVSSATLRGLQDMYNQAHWKIQQARHHRCLSYDKSVLCVLKGLNVIREDLENACSAEMREEFTPKHRTDAAAILKWITTEKNLRILFLLGDTLPHLAELSLVFQRQSVDVTYIQPKLDSTLGIIRARKITPGPWERKYFGGLNISPPIINNQNCSQETFQSSVKEPFLNALEKNLTSK